MRGDERKTRPKYSGKYSRKYSENYSENHPPVAGANFCIPSHNSHLTIPFYRASSKSGGILTLKRNRPPGRLIFRSENSAWSLILIETARHPVYDTEYGRKQYDPDGLERPEQDICNCLKLHFLPFIIEGRPARLPALGVYFQAVCVNLTHNGQPGLISRRLVWIPLARLSVTLLPVQ